MFSTDYFFTSTRELQNAHVCDTAIEKKKLSKII